MQFSSFYKFQHDQESVYALHDVVIRIQLKGKLQTSQVFSTLHALPCSEDNAYCWTIKTLSINDFSPLFSKSNKKIHRMRIWPNTDIAFQELDGGGLFVCIDKAAAMVNPDRKEIDFLFHADSLQPAQILGNFLVLELLRHEGCFTMHAGVVEYSQGAVLFCGASGKGKSTLTAALATLGNGRFMSDDRCVIYKKNGRLWVGGIADTVGMCKDSAMLLQENGVDLPSPLEMSERKIYLNCHEFFLNVGQHPYPICAVFILDDFDHDFSRVKVCTTEKAFQQLWHGSFYPGSARLAQAHFEILTEMAEGIPTHQILSKSKLTEMIAIVEKIVSSLPCSNVPIYPLPRLQLLREEDQNIANANKQLCGILASTNLYQELATISKKQIRGIIRTAVNANLLDPLAVVLNYKKVRAEQGILFGNILHTTSLRNGRIREIHHQKIIVVNQWLSKRKVRWAIIDGPSLAERFYSDPRAHYYSYLQVIIAEEAVDEAIAELLSLGFVKSPKISAEVALNRNDCGIFEDQNSLYELRLQKSRHVQQLLDRVETISLGQTLIPVVSATDQFLHSCLDSAKSVFSGELSPMYNIFSMVKNGSSLIGDGAWLQERLPEIRRILAHVDGYFPIKQYPVWQRLFD